MDKVKVALAMLKKYHFWVMLLAVLLMSLVGWWVATSQLWAGYKTERDKIVAEFGALNKIRSEEQKNQEWIDGLDKETQQLKAKVAQAWKKVYTEQRDSVLKWPEILGAENVARLEALGPNDPIDKDIRETYLTYIRTEFARMLEIVDARPALESKPGSKPTKSPEGDHEYKVVWDDKSQKEIDQQLDFHSTPDSQEVRLAQENLWVYEALLNIIKNLNDRATANYNAKVKVIEALSIGREAASLFQAGMAENHVDRPNVAAGATPAATPTTQAPPPAAATPAAAGTPEALLEGRYVNEAGAPLSGAEAAAGGSAEFKRMPIFMKLIMDQRDVSRLLVECANSPLPVEVRQFRLRAGGKAKSAGGGANRPMGGGDEREIGSYNVEVEIDGIIYIFNPPDTTKLGTAATPAPGQVGAVPPAAGAANPGPGR